MQLVVGRIGRPHGIRGQVTLEVRTDDPSARFAVGARLETEPAERGPLVIADAIVHSGRWVLSIDGVNDRSGAEALRDTMLVVDTADLPPIEDSEEFYDHELMGLSAELVDGSQLGTVSDVIHGPAGDLLAIARDGGGEVLLPFLQAMVPVVDVAGGRIVVAPPEGLLDL